MKFRPEDYFRTATQRIRQAHFLYREGESFSLTIYVAGLAVECLLRSFKGRRDKTFDERHDLLDLFKESGLLEIDRDVLLKSGMSERQIEEHSKTLQRGIQQIYQIWQNYYRFVSEEQLERHLKKTTGNQKIKGSYLKEQARRLLGAAQEFMDLGAVRWPL